MKVRQHPPRCKLQSPPHTHTHTDYHMPAKPSCMLVLLWNKNNLCSWTYTKLKCHPSDLLLGTLETGVDSYDNLNCINKLSNVTGNFKLSNHTCQKKTCPLKKKKKKKCVTNTMMLKKKKKTHIFVFAKRFCRFILGWLHMDVRLVIMFYNLSHSAWEKIFFFSPTVF